MQHAADTFADDAVCAFVEGIRAGIEGRLTILQRQADKRVRCEVLLQQLKSASQQRGILTLQHRAHIARWMLTELQDPPSSVSLAEANVPAIIERVLGLYNSGWNFSKAGMVVQNLHIVRVNIGRHGTADASFWSIVECLARVCTSADTEKVKQCSMQATYAILRYCRNRIGREQDAELNLLSSMVKGFEQMLRG